MSDSFEYTPRFKDMRIKKTKGKRKAQIEAEERVCEWPGCNEHAGSRCPKSNSQLNDFYWFCQKHAGQYNKSWNFFEGMGEGEAQAFRESAAYGHRPTWGWKGTKSEHTKSDEDFGDGFTDPYGTFGKKKRAEREDTPREKSQGRLTTKALETLDLSADTKPAAVRKRYAELVRRFHPDVNGGDRSSEEQLGRVIASYQILKNAGMA